MHIPKTSGTALMTTLAGALAPSAVVTGFDLCLFGSFRGFHTIDAGEQLRIYHSASSLPAADKLISGHFAFSTLRQAYPGAQIITVLRDPLSRLLSHWMFWRQNTDAMLSSWGSWSDMVRSSRQPLARFLNLPALACQIDNLILRMLLWPHALIREDQFIEPIHDERLLLDASARLRELAFLDVIENVNFPRNLEHWMGHALLHGHDNETRFIPQQYRSPLHREITPEAFELLHLRSRLDLRLWQMVVNERLPGCDVAALRERTTLAAMARYGALMAAE